MGRLLRLLLLSTLVGCAAEPVVAPPPSAPRDRPAGSDPPPRGLRKYRTSAGDRREYWVHCPPDARAGSPLPLVISIHGNGGNGLREVERWRSAADRERLLVCCPDSLGAHSGDPSHYPIDTSQYLAILEEVRDRYPVDPDRILLSGFSGGALSAYWAGVHHPAIFAGLGLRSPSFPHALYRCQSHLTAARTLPVYITFGEKDRPETLEDVQEAVALLRACGHAEPTLKVETVAGAGHDGGIALPRILDWFRPLRRRPSP